jgi:hypothetical protein
MQTNFWARRSFVGFALLIAIAASAVAASGARGQRLSCEGLERSPGYVEYDLRNSFGSSASRASFGITLQTLSDAFDTYCTMPHETSRPCDSFANYDWTVTVESHELRIVFLHVSTPQEANAEMIFCRAARNAWQCIAQ